MMRSLLILLATCFLAQRASATCAAGNQELCAGLEKVLQVLEEGGGSSSSPDEPTQPASNSEPETTTSPDPDPTSPDPEPTPNGSSSAPDEGDKCLRLGKAYDEASMERAQRGCLPAEEFSLGEGSDAGQPSGSVALLQVGRSGKDCASLKAAEDAARKDYASNGCAENCDRLNTKSDILDMLSEQNDCLKAKKKPESSSSALHRESEMNADQKKGYQRAKIMNEIKKAGNPLKHVSAPSDGLSSGVKKAFVNCQRLHKLRTELNAKLEKCGPAEVGAPQTPNPLLRRKDIAAAKLSILGFITGLFEEHYHSKMAYKSSKSLADEAALAHAAVNKLADSCKSVGNLAENAGKEVQRALVERVTDLTDMVMNFEGECSKLSRNRGRIDDGLDVVEGNMVQLKEQAEELEKGTTEQISKFANFIKEARKDLEACNDKEAKDLAEKRLAMVEESTKDLEKFVADRKAEYEAVKAKAESMDKLKKNREEAKSKTKQMLDKTQSITAALQKASGELERANRETQNTHSSTSDSDLQFIALSEGVTSEALSSTITALLDFETPLSVSLFQQSAESSPASAAGNSESASNVQIVSWNLHGNENWKEFEQITDTAITTTSSVLTTIKKETSYYSYLEKKAVKEASESLSNIQYTAAEKEKLMKDYQLIIRTLHKANMDLIVEIDEFTTMSKTFVSFIAEENQKLEETIRTVTRIQSVVELLAASISQIQAKQKALVLLAEKYAAEQKELGKCVGKAEGRQQMLDAFKEDLNNPAHKAKIQSTLESVEKNGVAIKDMNEKYDDTRAETEKLMDDLEDLQQKVNSADNEMSKAAQDLKTQKSALEAKGVTDADADAAVQAARDEVKGRAGLQKALKSIASEGENIVASDFSGEGELTNRVGEQNDVQVVLAQVSMNGNKKGQIKLGLDRPLRTIRGVLASQFKIDNSKALNLNINVNGKAFGEGCQGATKKDCNTPLFKFVQDKSGPWKRMPQVNNIELSTDAQGSGALFLE